MKAPFLIQSYFITGDGFIKNGPAVTMISAHFMADWGSAATSMSKFSFDDISV